MKSQQSGRNLRSKMKCRIKNKNKLKPIIKKMMRKKIRKEMKKRKRELIKFRREKRKLGRERDLEMMIETHRTGEKGEGEGKDPIQGKEESLGERGKEGIIGIAKGDHLLGIKNIERRGIIIIEGKVAAVLLVVALVPLLEPLLPREGGEVY